MRHDPLFTSWLVKCSSAEESQRLQQLLRAAIHADAAYVDIVRPSPKGTESSATIAHRLGDYFSDICLLPGGPAGSLTFRIVYSRRADAGRFWKDLMVRTVQEIRKSSPGATTTLEYWGDEEPETLGAIG